jgi:alkanesulfonate monooxygenase SsuD/methylene tetrahydromethanopterin reductase-like flavin-dependent oxidoreductase (luciferase family)
MAAVDAHRQPPLNGTAFALRDPWPWPVFSSLARAGDELAYRAVFLPEIAGRDAFAALTGLAGETSQLLLGTGVVPMTSRRAELTAMGAATVHERSGGRAILGIGTGPPRRGALDELRAQVAVLRSRLGAGASGADTTSSLMLERPVPIWIAALGPRAIALGGAVADGVLLNWCSPERVSEAKDAIARAAGAAGRDPGEVTVGAYIRSAVGGAPGQADAARTAVARAASEYASYPAYRRQFDAMGLSDAAQAAADASAAGRAPQPDLVAPLIDAICLTGAPGSARSRVQTYRDAGCDLPVIYPVPFGDDRPGSVGATLQALAPASG